MTAVTIVPEISELTPLETEHLRFHEGSRRLLGLPTCAIEGLPREGQPPVFEATVQVDHVLDHDGERVERTYRWQVIEGTNGPRATAQWRRPDGAWSLVRRTETCVRLLALTPAEHRGPA